jgi:hypothetical protein
LIQIDPETRWFVKFSICSAIQAGEPSDAPPFPARLLLPASGVLLLNVHREMSQLDPLLRQRPAKLRELILY